MFLFEKMMVQRALAPSSLPDSSVPQVERPGVGGSHCRGVGHPVVLETSSSKETC